MSLGLALSTSAHFAALQMMNEEKVRQQKNSHKELKERIHARTRSGTILEHVIKRFHSSSINL